MRKIGVCRQRIADAVCDTIHSAMKNSGFDQYYDEAVEPGKRERAYAWATAIGLQDVDGLRPSKHLLATAKRHIEGEITQEEARRIVDEYYETKDGHDLPKDTKEADRVAARIVAVINSPTFVFSPAYLIGLHEKIFEGIFSHAGKIREVELTKHEDVLNGASVEYAPSFMVMKTLEYDFDKEAKFGYKGISDDAFVAHFSEFIAKIWQAHPFREGNTRTTAVFAIKYLRTKGFDVTNDLFARESWYFRNALVRANYENTQLNVAKTTAYLEDFFKVLLFGEEIELKNRFLRIGFEYGSSNAEKVAELHRRKDSHGMGGNAGGNMGGNRLSSLPAQQQEVCRLMLKNPSITAAQIAELQKVRSNTIEKRIAVLRKKGAIVREGGTRGVWKVLWEV